MGALTQDLRYGLKMLARSPGFTFAAVLSIALGIGVNTTIFSFINGLLFRPLPFPEAHRLVRVWDGRSSSYPDYVAYRDESRVFEGLAAYSPRSLSLNVGGEAERVSGEIVSGNYFDVLGVRPAPPRRRPISISQPSSGEVRDFEPGCASGSIIIGTQRSGGEIRVAPPNFSGMTPTTVYG